MKKGFSFVEVLIVVAIISILATIAIPSFIKAKEQALANDKGYNVENSARRGEMESGSSYECTKILMVNGIEVYKFRENVTQPWVYLTIAPAGGKTASIGH